MRLWRRPKNDLPKEKKSKKTKQSKRSKNAYMFYLDDVRADVRELMEQENAQDGGKYGVSAASVAKKVGEMWNDIKNTAAAEVYKQKAADAKAALISNIESESQEENIELTQEEVSSESVIEGDDDPEHVTVSVVEETANAIKKAKEMVTNGKPKSEKTPPPSPSPSENDDDLGTEVEEIEYNDEIYLKDPETGLLYNEEGEEVGSINEDGEVTIN